MLLLGRKLGERIHIGGGITVLVADIDRGVVRLGIQAPPDVPVHREEIAARLTEPERAALLADPRDAELHRLRARVTELETRLTYHGAEPYPHGPGLAELDDAEAAESERYTTSQPFPESFTVAGGA